MAKTTLSQRKTAGRVMHEFAHGELKSGRGGKGGKVKSRKQAIAIAINESGASKYESKSENARHLATSKRKERGAKHPNRNGKASPTSVPVENVRAAPRWAAGTPRREPPVGGRRQLERGSGASRPNNRPRYLSVALALSSRPRRAGARRQ